MHPRDRFGLEVMVGHLKIEVNQELLLSYQLPTPLFYGNHSDPKLSNKVNRGPQQ